MATKWAPETCIRFQNEAGVRQTIRRAGRWGFTAALRLARAKGAAGMVEVEHRSDHQGQYGLGRYGSDTRLYGDESGSTAISRE